VARRICNGDGREGDGDTIGMEAAAPDKQAAIMRVVNMESPKSWIEGQLLRVTKQGSRRP